MHASTRLSSFKQLFLFLFLAKMLVLQEAEEVQADPPDYICLSGKNPATLTHKQVLKEFAKGPCSPVMIVPGLMSTVVAVEVDCEVLLSHNQEVASACGWNACSKSSYEFWKSVPEKEYRLWIPYYFSPLNIFTIKQSNNFCWSKFFKLNMDFNLPLEQALIPPVGFTVKLWGDTPQTRGKAACGDKAITDLMDSYLENKSTQIFDKLFVKLKNMGYVAGLTYQSMPYDYRISYRTNELNKTFEDNLVKLNLLTNKRVIIYGHSLGNVNIYHQLLKMSPEKKNKLIRTWVNIAGPILGAVKTIRFLVSGDSDLIFFKGYFGLHFDASVEACNNTIVLYELLPIDVFTLYQDQPWFRRIIQRTRYENGEVPYEESGYRFLPKTEDSCTPETFTAFDESCRFGFYDTKEGYTVKIMDEEYKLSQLHDLMKEWSLTEDTHAFYDITRDPKREVLENPGVPLISVVLRTQATPIKFNYKEDIRKYVERDEFYMPEMEYSYGDGTVESASLFIPSLKWAQEFDDGRKDSHPVKIVELCSRYNRRGGIYDNTDGTGVFKVLNNEYIGLPCDCDSKKQADDCGHEFMVSDSQVINLTRQILVTMDYAYTESYYNFINQVGDDFLNLITQRCPQIYRGEHYQEYLRFRDLYFSAEM